MTAAAATSDATTTAQLHAAAVAAFPDITRLLGDTDAVRAASDRQTWTDSWVTANTTRVLGTARKHAPRLVGGIDLTECAAAVTVAARIQAAIAATYPAHDDGTPTLDVDTIAAFTVGILRAHDTTRRQAALAEKKRDLHAALTRQAVTAARSVAVGRITEDHVDTAGRLLIPAGTFVDVTRLPMFGPIDVAVTDQHGRTETVTVPRRAVAIIRRT